MNYESALRIAYPLRDTLMADTVRYMTNIDHLSAQAAEIERIAKEYTGTLHGRNSLRDDPEVDRKLDAYLDCLLNSKTGCSVNVAQHELMLAMLLASMRMAVNEFRAKAKQAEEDAAVEAWERRQERCEVMA